MKTSVFKTNGNVKRDLRFLYITINLFAFIHAAVCFILLSLNLDDGLFLTILTIAMIVILIYFFNGTTDVFLSLSLLSILAGFYMGTKGADLIYILLPGYSILTHVIATIVVTEILGWSVYFILRKRANRG